MLHNKDKRVKCEDTFAFDVSYKYECIAQTLCTNGFV